MDREKKVHIAVAAGILVVGGLIVLALWNHMSPLGRIWAGSLVLIALLVYWILEEFARDTKASKKQTQEMNELKEERRAHVRKTKETRAIHFAKRSPPDDEPE